MPKGKNSKNYFYQEQFMTEKQIEGADKLPLLLVSLLKGIVYRDSEPVLWQSLIELQIRARDYLGVIGLELLVDENEGYAWLKQCDAVDGEEIVPRLVGRRQLSYPVSLLIALFRKRLAEHDASGGETRLIMSNDEVVEMCRAFFPAGSNDARFFDQITSHINKVVELGFVRKLKGEEQKIEVCRIIKAFVTAQWLNEFDQRLEEYYKNLAESGQEANS